ncbi:hypothetical protein [Flexivirga aerilata]|nr:hypothetical protein [Flexivirga aerilata]
MVDALVIAGCGLAAVVLGAVATIGVFRLVEASGSQDATHSLQDAGSILRGGMWIGALERVAIYAGLVAGWPEAIAIVLAVKGLGRYPELKSGDQPAVAERFIIGTFVSVLSACACAGVAHALVG